MLLSFRFANHRSFEDEQQLNLTPVYPSDSPGGGDAVKVVGIFGANASGKSNALGALSYLQGLVLRSDKDNDPGVGIPREPFRLGAESWSAPSRYVVDLNIDHVRYAYGLEVDSERVVNEWLYSYPLGHRRKVFERRGDDYSYGEDAQRTAIARIEEVTASNVLFLSTAARFNQSLVQPVYEWFRARLTGPAAIDRRFFLRQPSSIARQLLRNAEDRGLMVTLLRAADTGIVDLAIETELPDVSEAALVDRLQAEFGKDSEGLARRLRELTAARTRLLFVHQGAERQAHFDIADESAGTLQLFQLAYLALGVLRRGGTLLVDEIDSSLHPLATAKIIGLFQSPEANRRGAQLLFTSHDATLLGSLDGAEVLRRDQVWFIEKDAATGVSVLYPLSDFHPRKEDSRQRRYLNGSYGAVPDGSWELFTQALREREAHSGPEDQEPLF